MWPPMVARWAGVLMPRALVPHKTPTSSGGPNVRMLFDRMSPNGVLLFDEYDDPEWPGANRAVDEFCDGHGIRLHNLVKDNYKKSFIMAPPA